MGPMHMKLPITKTCSPVTAQILCEPNPSFLERSHHNIGCIWTFLHNLRTHCHSVVVFYNFQQISVLLHTMSLTFPHSLKIFVQMILVQFNCSIDTFVGMGFKGGNDLDIPST